MSEEKVLRSYFDKNLFTCQKRESVCSLIQENQGKLGTEILLEKRFIQASSVKEILPHIFFFLSG